MEKLDVLVAEIRERLAGRKTYLLAVLLVVTVLVLVFLGRLSPETALAVAMVFAGLISASFRSAIEQHHAEVVNLLIDVAEVGDATLAHHQAQALKIAEASAPLAATLASELRSEVAAGAKS